MLAAAGENGGNGGNNMKEVKNRIAAGGEEAAIA